MTSSAARARAWTCARRRAAGCRWRQVHADEPPLIVGVDLAPIKPIRGCTTFVDDITTQSRRAQLKRCTPDGVQYDVVIHDGAPNVGGNFAAERYTQAALTLDSLRLATEFLKEGGWFVTKVFRGDRVPRAAVLYAAAVPEGGVHQAGGVARHVRGDLRGVPGLPGATEGGCPSCWTRGTSSPSTRGRRQAVDVLSHAKRPRNRSGYEDGVSALYKRVPRGDLRAVR